jgi:hypothetical protein
MAGKQAAGVKRSAPGTKRRVSDPERIRLALFWNFRSNPLLTF